MGITSIDCFGAAVPSGDIGRYPLYALHCLAVRSFTRLPLGAVESDARPAKNKPCANETMMLVLFGMASTLGRFCRSIYMVSTVLGLLVHVIC